jgi:hypothetical protein
MLPSDSKKMPSRAKSLGNNAKWLKKMPGHSALSPSDSKKCRVKGFRDFAAALDL